MAFVGIFQVGREQSGIVGSHLRCLVTQNSLQHNAVTATLKPLANKSEPKRMWANANAFNACLFRPKGKSDLCLSLLLQSGCDCCDERANHQRWSLVSRRIKYLMQHNLDTFTDWNEPLFAAFPNNANEALR
jgi:hypothetical protein